MEAISVGAYTGNFAVEMRALAYIYSLGKESIKWVGPLAVLNANYIRERLKDDYELPIGDHKPGEAYHACMHEFVFTLDTHRAALFIED